MNLATLQFRSAALSRQVTYSAILPESGQGPFPVVMQLHGFSDDHTAWTRLSRLIEHARPYPFVIAMPDGGTSFYLDLTPRSGAGSLRYEEFLVEDLRRHVEGTFRVRTGPWAIGGLSMGGFGAVRLGLKYPARFASVWAHSARFYTRAELASGERPRFAGAPAIDAADADVFALAERGARSGAVPRLSFDCGVDDELIGDNRRLHAHLDGIGLRHTYREHPGGHTWPYWDEHVRAALAQHAEVFGVGTETPAS